MKSSRNRPHGDWYHRFGGLPVFVKQFKGKTLTGHFSNIYSADEGYRLKFKILNDSTLTYQTWEYDDDYTSYLRGESQKWSKSKKISFSLVPSCDSCRGFIRNQLTFKFEGYQGEVNVSKNEKKQKYHISTPLTLTDADNLNATFWDI